MQVFAGIVTLAIKRVLIYMKDGPRRQLLPVFCHFFWKGRYKDTDLSYNRFQEEAIVQRFEWY